MMSKRSKKSLSDRLAELTSAAPSASFNPDAPDFDDGTGAGLSRYGDDGDYEDEAGLAMRESWPSADLRVAADMESIGQEYHGKRVSRKNLEATVGDAHDPDRASVGGSDADDDILDDSEDEGGAVSSSKRMVSSLNLDDISSSEDDEDEDAADDSEGDSNDDADKTKTSKDVGSGREKKRVHWQGDDVEEDRDEGLRGGSKRPRQQQANVFDPVKGSRLPDATLEEQMRKFDKQDDRAKRAGGGAVGRGELRRAKEVLRQREWWDSLLEVRILLQRLMNAANKLPGPDELPLYLQGDEELAALAKEGAGAAQNLSTTLSSVRRSHMACWGITTTDSSGDGGSSVGERDTATGASVTGDGAVEDGDGNVEAMTAARDHGSCMGWWEGVLGQWHERTQLVDPSLQKKFRVVNQGPWAQVTASLADKERANRRAFMTESETEDFLGRELARRLKKVNGASKTDSGLVDSGAVEGKGVDEDLLGHERREAGADPLDLEVIDDRDLYQQLLKEFMDASGAAGSGYASVPVRRKSRKKSVDRKASKGRKIKYVTHPKMQNFMFPQEYEPPPMEPSELFASLFGGAGSTPVA